MYMTIGNIPKDTRKRIKGRSTLLLGYLPVTRLDIFEKDCGDHVR